jgi:hypothetical protein
MMKSQKIALIVLLTLLLLPIRPGVAQEEEPPYLLYLPLVAQPTFTRVTVTQPANWVLYSRGADFAAATQATDIEVRYNDVTFAAWNTGNAPPYSPQYTLTRSFTAFDMSSVPEGSIVKAQLELYPWSTKLPATIEFWQGTWSGTPTAAAWDARGELLATLPLTRTPGVTDPLTVTLALEGQPVPEVLYLVLRGDESSAMNAFQSLGAAFGIREMPEMPGMPISKLHLWIAP